jgi:hypothetical protein
MFLTGCAQTTSLSGNSGGEAKEDEPIADEGEEGITGVPADGAQPFTPTGSNGGNGSLQPPRPSTASGGSRSFVPGKLGSYKKGPDGKWGDCRDDWPEFQWEGHTNSECAEMGGGLMAKGEGFMPGIAFKACKIEGVCYRFSANLNECQAYPFPRNSVYPQKNDNLYCLEAMDAKDTTRRNESYYSCFVNGRVWRFQAVDLGGVNYRDKGEMEANGVGDLFGQVADNLPFLKFRKGCAAMPGTTP